MNQQVYDNYNNQDSSDEGNVQRDRADEVIKEIKSFEKKMILFMIIFTISVLIVVFAGVCMSKNTHRIEAASRIMEDTEFKSILTSVINELSVQDNLQYALDERYYDENDVITYISVISEQPRDEITADAVKSYFWDIFIPIRNNDVVDLIKKDNLTLILECENKIKMNKLDHVFMGIANNEIIKASRGVYISQNQDKFENIPYGTANVKTSGCGPISLTMAINYLHDTNVVSLEDVLTWAEENDMYEENSGTKWSLIRNFPANVSVNSKEMYINNYETFKSSLADGEVLVTTMGPGHFTDDGHFIVITEIKDGMASVLDPASICRSLKKWDATIIFEESKQYFWKISKRDSL